MKIKRFSIESGHPDKGGSLGRELITKIKEGALFGGSVGSSIGAVVGLDVALISPSGNRLKSGLGALAGGITGGAIVCALLNAFTSVGANSRLAKAKGLTINELLDRLYDTDKDAKLFNSVKIDRYILEDQDPIKFMVNFAYNDGMLIMYLNNPTADILKEINEILENMIAHNRKGDYASYPVKNSKGSYMVFVSCPSIDSAVGILFDFIVKKRQKINVLTEKSFKNIDIEK